MFCILRTGSRVDFSRCMAAGKEPADTELCLESGWGALWQLPSSVTTTIALAKFFIRVTCIRTTASGPRANGLPSFRTHVFLSSPFPVPSTRLRCVEPSGFGVWAMPHREDRYQSQRLSYLSQASRQTGPSLFIKRGIRRLVILRPRRTYGPSIQSKPRKGRQLP